MSIALAAILALIGAANRLIPHYPNAVALGAISLYAGARLPRRWAFAVPMVAMLISDAIIDRHYQLGLSGFASPVRLVTYVTFGLIALAGGSFRSGVGAAGRGGLSIAGSTAFFLASNFAVWASFSGEGSYAKTTAGLGSCYLAGLPFFRNGLLADLLGTALLFGLEPASIRALGGVKPAPAAPEIVG